MENSQKTPDDVERELLALFERGATESEVADFAVRELQAALNQLRHAPTVRRAA